MSDNKDFTVRVPDEIAALTDDELTSEIEAMVAHEQADVLTDEQATYLGNLRDELFKRAAVGGPYSDYTGP